MLTLNDGRTELWQWDTGRTLAVDADCSQVHFSNKVFGRSIDVDVVDGAAVIPDILLQTDKDLNVWAFVGTAENGYTKISKTFNVNRRNKPADYVFTPVEQTTIAEIAAIAQSVRDDADAGLFNGKRGSDGGWYTPSVTQPDENTLRMAFTPSKDDMPAVADTDITLPSGGGGGGSAVELDTTLSEAGKAADAKAVGDALNKVTAGVVVGRFFGKVANFLGDSQTDDAGNYKSVFFYDWLKNILGLSATNNYGYSGATIMPIEGQTRSFLERYTGMSDDADLIVVWGGTNDYQYGHAIGKVDDTANTTFCGALNQLCKGLIAKYPQKGILFVTPTPRGNISGAVATQKEYADAIIEVCGKYCIPVFDAFRKCNMPIVSDTAYDSEGNIIRKYTVDGLHLNDLGHEILGKSMANFILYSEMAGAQTAWSESGGEPGIPEEPDNPGDVVNVTGVTLDKTTHSFAIGETVQLTATVVPSDATNKNVLWSASNGNCTVNNGLVTAVTTGDCAITATTEDGGFTATCVVTVSEPAADAPASPVDGKTVTFTASSSDPSNCNNLTLLVNASDCPVPEKGLLTVRANISDATQTITAYGKGMQAFQDDTGELNNGKFKSDVYTGVAVIDGVIRQAYVTSEMTGNTIVAYAGVENPTMNYNYVKIPVSIVPAAWPVSFKIESMTVDVNGTYIPIRAVGGFYAAEGYSES